MKKVITYGTFDLFHEGHRKLLERAKKIGDYLIVGVTTDNYDDSRGKLNVQQSLMERIDNVRQSGLADEIIIEEYEGQKINDIQKYGISIFAIGSDWKGKFDYLSDYCEVVYLERTKNISSTLIRAENHGVLKIGVVGYGRIANRFINESKFVSGIVVQGVYGRNADSLKQFVNKHELVFGVSDYSDFLDKVDAVYVASPHLSHYKYIKSALLHGKHVLCEKPMVLNFEESKELYALANDMKLVLLEAIKTAYSPGFIRLISIAKSGLIGKIINVDATFTKLVDGNIRELDYRQAGGSITELASYPLLAIFKLLGTSYTKTHSFSYFDQKLRVDLFTKTNILYKNACASLKVGLGVKSEGDLIISGTQGYIYVPSPWWKTEQFEIRFEDSNKNIKHYHKFEGDGLRYEIAEFVSMINKNVTETYKLTQKESMEISKVIEEFICGNSVEKVIN